MKRTSTPNRLSGNALLGIALASVATFSQEWWDVLPRPEWASLERFPVQQPTDWFEVYRVEPGVFALYEPGHWEEAIAYLVVGTDRALLFDTLMGIAALRPIVDALTDLPVVVVNSHSHYDHVGSNHEFDTVLAADSAFARDNARGLGPAESLAFIPEGSIGGLTPPEFDRDTWRVRSWSIDGVVADGDVIDLGGRRLEVLLTPGHAPDALCLLDRDNGLLFTGDTYYRGPLFAQLPGSDLGQYGATAARLAQLRSHVRLLLPAHNTTAVPADDLLEFDAALRAVIAGDAAYDETGGVREYTFRHFTLRTQR